MTKLHNDADLSQAASDDEGVCLECGEVQPFLERRTLLGLCGVCEEQRVMHAQDVVAVVTLLQNFSDDWR